MKTTMNAELSSDEEHRVLAAWDALHAACSLDSSYTIPDMLSFATSIVMAAHELRRAIADACHYAERRAFPDSHHPKGHKVAGSWDLAQRLAELGITEEDFAAILKKAKP